ncbi:MHS family MFS transporter [Solirubrobacter sp. CPCC 204708]|uniref:MHS family MFS transporter n=1 Tax=Solirubrobacter deserti TaxID=2282478 RepID=A0ABT4RLW0_9ACTN|nr:MFS transporter [Solirubrobacter deserti]MBE2314401.1 MHS family MFS transporter [Solirubrobacter deserti]MDA0139548.1 MHS family MFS transporter [Solirubrobacter deserti]
MDEAPRSSALRRALAGSVVGTALEWYDFFIYGTAAALVFDELFFNDKEGSAGTLAAFATFGVGFAVRPLGGVLFGNMGDRIGRRETLVVTTLLMGISTGVIGLLPTYDSIGIWAPILLTLMRVCQGLGAGAEFGGASTLLAEHAPKERRGFYGSFAQLGVQTGLVLGTLTFLIVGQLPDEDLNSWGWRIPFLISFLMIFVTLYFRLRVEESPVFEALRAQRKVVKVPVLDTIKRYPKSVAVAAGAHIADTAVIYIFVTFSVAYVTDQLDLSRTTALGGVVVAAFVGVLLQPVYGALSDRIGRKPLNLWSVIFTALYAFPFWLLVDTGSPAVIWLALTIGLAIGLGPMIAVQGAFNAELFGADVRYTGFAGSRELGAALVGFSPTLSVALLGWGDDEPWLVAVWMIVACLISLAAFVASRETKDVDMVEA